MPGKSYQTTEATNGACFDDDLLYRHLEKMTTPEEAARIEQHLNECNACFADVAALMEMVQTPVTEAERIEIARSRKISPEEQVEKILKIFDDERQPASVERPVMTPPAPHQVLQIFFAIWRQHRRYAFALMFLLGLGSFAGVPFYRNYQNASSLARVERELRQNYQVYVNVDDFAESAPRLSGSYAHQPIFAMAGEEEPAYIADSRQRLKEVLARDAESVKAQHLLAQTFIMRGAFAPADSVLRRIPPASLREASLLNDQGVLYWASNNPAAAATAFADALKADPKLLAAQYNLALIKARMGATAEAIKILEEYVRVETDAGWQRAADAVLEKLREKNG